MDKPQILDKWESVAAIRDFYRRSRVKLKELAARERDKLLTREEAEVEAFKAARGEWSREQQKERNRINRAEQRAKEKTDG